MRTVKIDSIIDFGRYGFTGVSIETMCMIIYPRQKPKDTTVYSMKYNVQHTRSQEYLTDPAYPSFVIYRDEQFDEVAKKLRFDVFTVFRDRQITKANTVAKSNGNCLWVIKARNIDDDGLGITHIPDYDVYLPMQIAETVSASQFVNNERVYLTPNMTYNPRVIDNLANAIPDGSVAVLIPKEDFRLTAKHMHHIFPKYRYQEIAEYLENLIALTSGQHLQKAHPNGNTSAIDKDYQYTCLIAKTDSIRKNLMDNHGEPVIYDFADFMYVLDVGLETDYFGALPQYDFGAVLTGIEINF